MARNQAAAALTHADWQRFAETLKAVSPAELAILVRAIERLVDGIDGDEAKRMMAAELAIARQEAKLAR